MKKKKKLEQFKIYLKNKPLLNENLNNLEIDNLANLYKSSLKSVVDGHAPEINKVIKLKSSCLWYNHQLKIKNKKNEDLNADI